MSDRYFKAAKQYLPKNRTRVLFVAEAPPNSIDRYFYFEEVERDDWLWIALMKCLYPAGWSTTKHERENKKEWLTRFQRDGFRLLDALKKPVSGNANQRILEITKRAEALTNEVMTINPECIVLIKKTVYLGLFEKLKAAGLRVANLEALPFPSSGQQNIFHDKASSLDCVKEFVVEQKSEY